MFSICFGNMVMQRGQVPDFADFEQFFFGKTKAVELFVPMRLYFNVQVHPDAHLAFKFFHPLQLNVVFNNRNDNQPLVF